MCKFHSQSGHEIKPFRTHFMEGRQWWEFSRKVSAHWKSVQHDYLMTQRGYCRAWEGDSCNLNKSTTTNVIPFEEKKGTNYNHEIQIQP